MIDTHSLWAWVHILLFAYWIGADAGLWLSMGFIRDPKYSYETRATLIKLAFYIDLFPRITFALILPVGMHLARDLGVAPIGDGLIAAAWAVGIAWSALHLAVVRWKGTALARALLLANKGYEALAGLAFIVVGAVSLARGAPVTAGWFALKLVLFGIIFWVILGIDTVFQPFTTFLRMGPTGSTPEKEAAITRLTNQTMAWALLLYALLAAVAFLGRVKPFW